MSWKSRVTISGENILGRGTDYSGRQKLALLRNRKKTGKWNMVGKIV